MKQCFNFECKKTNPQSEDAFGKDKASKDGLTIRCKECEREDNRNYYLKNKTKLQMKWKEKYIRNKEYYLKKSKIDKIKFKDRNFNNKLKLKYNITKEDYDRFLLQQDKKCAICRKEEIDIDKRNNKIRELAVDHSHETGKVRGLLCGKCNKAIGLLKDSTELLTNAINYLKENE